MMAESRDLKWNAYDFGIKVLQFSFFLFFNPQNDNAQVNDSTGNMGKVTWVEHFNKRIHIKITQSTNVENLKVVTTSNNLSLSPNSKSVSRLSLDYEFISLSFSFTAKFLPGNDDDDIRGKTKNSGLGLNVNLGHWFNSISYSKTTGYFLENTNDFRPGWTEGDAYIQFPDLVFKTYQLASIYSFNQNFSFTSLTSQTARQTKSTGTFMPNLMVKYYITDDRSVLSATHTTQRSSNFEILTGPGYQYQWVLPHRFYFSIGATADFGLVVTNFITRALAGNVTTKQTNFKIRLNGVSGLGYNGQRFFTGIYAAASGSTLRQQNTTVVDKDARVNFQIFAGIRFKSPKKIQQEADRINKMMKSSH